MRTLVSLAVFVLAGCTAAPEAPTELGELTLFLFSEFETADDAYLADALLNLEGVFGTVDLEGERSDRQWVQPILTPEYWGGASGPDPDVVPPEDQVPISVAGLSEWPVSAHATAVLEPDQSQLEPSAPSHDRTYPDGTECWAAGECHRLDTENHVTKANILYTIIYDTEKDFRRLTLEDGRAAMVARTWNDQQAFGEQGVNSIDQNYACEVFIEHADDPGRTQRMMSIWTSTTLSADPEDSVVRGIIANGIDGVFRRHDEWQEEQQAR